MGKIRGAGLAFLSLCILLCFSSCQTIQPLTQGTPSPTAANTPSPTSATSSLTPVASSTATTGTTPQPSQSPVVVQVPGHKMGTPTPGSKATPTPGAGPFQPAPPADNSRPVLAFYYTWYTSSTWCSCKMPDLPTLKYNSADDATIDRQLNWAAGAGITGFISSWWGAGDQTDTNFAKLLAHSATLQKQKGYKFTSTIYFESDAPNLVGTANMISSLRYMASHYTNNPNFFHYQGKPVLFFWNPLGNGRTLAQWASIRSQVDPNHQMLWSAEGVDMNLLSVFDGIHLFSGGYWGIQHNTMTAVDQGFRDKVDAYNSANGTHKIWAAGVIPGYDDTRIPGRVGAYSVPRNNGATYNTSWSAAIASDPEWITITSFNEWFEGAMIEPSVTYGTQYLTLTQQFSREWRS